ncbi:hypothetical protein CVT24_004348 [Panaeolus cyanescens]|uniref:DUF6534 domain-containing protein n=1 Tax=Panaeolus cyanescens TaxID=181874 RepID=A0A409W7S0_9AGAR|nr:hypothetical protein CVT24_004348 [Panaeolus cyanescens]
MGTQTFTQALSNPLPHVSALYLLQSVATLICDVAITVCLVRTLNNAKSGMKKSNTMVNELIVNAINRGGLTAAVAALNLILLLVKQKTVYFYVPLLLIGKLYMNSALASLNERQYIRKKFASDVADDWAECCQISNSNVNGASSSVIDISAQAISARQLILEPSIEGASSISRNDDGPETQRKISSCEAQLES